MKSGLSIILHPQASLHQSSRDIADFDEKLKTLATKMGQAMSEFNGIGLAASQVGQNIKLIVVQTSDEEYQAYINLTITFYSKDKSMSEEGCLSIPEVYGYIERSTKIRFSYYDLQGKKHRDKAKGMLAIILQHECDHINGQLIIDKMTRVTRGHEKLEQLQSNDKNAKK